MALINEKIIRDKWRDLMKIVIMIISILLGAGLGWLYYKFVGCRSGACPLTSNPWSTLVIGALIGASFLPEILAKIIK